MNSGNCEYSKDGINSQHETGQLWHCKFNEGTDEFEWSSYIKTEKPEDIESKILELLISRLDDDQLSKRLRFIASDLYINQPTGFLTIKGGLINIVCQQKDSKTTYLTGICELQSGNFEKILYPKNMEAEWRVDSAIQDSYSRSRRFAPRET